MFKRLLVLSFCLPILVALAVLIGCTKSSVDSAGDARAVVPAESQSPETAAAEGEHVHEEGAHGGIIVSLGRDSYHVEAIVAHGELRLYTLGNDETRVLDIESQELQGYVKRRGASEATPITLTPSPQPGDGEGKSSLFVAKLSSDLEGKAIEVTVPNITIGGERFRFTFSTEREDSSHGASSVPGAPAKVTSDAERKLYLEPGGIYTQADIDANGRQTGSQKFADFQAAHDLEPQPGDNICPITLTKANSDCSWIVGGKEYQFCCPPCVDEFVALAKNEPEKVKAPDEYVQGEANEND